MSTKQNNRGLFFQRVVFALAGGVGLFGEHLSAQQPAVLSTTLASNQIIVFPDVNTPATQSIVPGLPAGAQPHSVSYYGSDHALVGDADRSRIFVVQISTATLVSTIDTTHPRLT